MQTQNQLPPTMYASDRPPLSGSEGDLWIDIAQHRIFILASGTWAPALVIPAPTVRCAITGSHSVNTDVVRYSDGHIVGYCQYCDERIELPYVPGGMNAAVLRDLAAAMLETPSADQESEFIAMLDKANDDYEELGRAVAAGRLAMSIVAIRDVEKHTA